MAKTARVPFGQFHYGVCYYPEHWHPSRHDSDIDRIADCGFTYVRLGEGAWAYFEPEEGKYQFDMFDRVIARCRKRKLKVIFGTPTYCGPAWIAEKYPEVLRWDFTRIPMKHGGRRNYNYTSPKYLELSDRICTALAEHYADEPAIIGWQLDNEFNCHMDVSYAPSDTLAWRKWLKEKYRTLDRLNTIWGTAFWSQTYTNWDQIDLPHPTCAHLNPHVLLDETRFISDCVVRFARRQAQILRQHNPRWIITHNGLFNNVKGTDLVAELDVFSHDQYPLFWNEGEWWCYNNNLIQARSLSFPFGILEQQSGPGGQLSYLQRTPRPGEMRLWAWQCVAHGASFLSYFRWRTCPYGSEQHWHGLLDPDDRDNRRIEEARATGKEFKALPTDFLQAAPVREIGVLRDFDNEANDRRINTYNKSGQWEQHRWMQVLSQAQRSVDNLWPESDFNGYSTIIAPHLKIMDQELVGKLTAFVRKGGTLILGAQSGRKDRNLHLVEQPLPGLLQKLAGLEVVDWSTLSDKQTRAARLNDGSIVELMTFVERLKPSSAIPLARWTGSDSLLDDAPAITKNRVGKGQVIYIGGYCDHNGIRKLLPLLPPSRFPVLDTPPSVEVIRRRNSRVQYTILLNHGPQRQRVSGLPKGKNLLTQQPTGEELHLSGYDVMVIQHA